MKTTIKLMAACGILALSLAFSFPLNSALNVTYGVSTDDPSQIKLELRDDFTFSYQDFSDKENRIEVSGNYELNNGKLTLMADDKAVSFHENWKLSEDGQRAKSRKGLSFYSLLRKD